jgi:hypothetical protein
VSTLTAFAVLDRTLQVTLPGGATTATKYGFAPDRKGVPQFSTKRTDANGKQSQQFTDARGRITSIKQYTSAGDAWTRFTYGALGKQPDEREPGGLATPGCGAGTGRGSI